MDKMKFVPEGELEEAILNKDNGKIIRLCVEAAGKDGRGLTRPNILATEEFYSLPERTAAVTVGCAINGSMRQNALSFVRRRHLESKVELLEEVRRTPETEPSADEENLMRAVAAGDSRKVRFLVEEKHCSLRSLTKEKCAVLCKDVLKLVPHALVLLYTDGIHCASVPFLLKFLLEKCENAEDWTSREYKFLLMLTNLLIHVLQGEILPEDDALVEEDWYPMGGSVAGKGKRPAKLHTYSYYYDPGHMYEPRTAEKNA